MAVEQPIEYNIEDRYQCSWETMDSLPRAADAEHLTEALRRSGAVGLAHVRDVAMTSSLKKPRSLTLRLRLTYEGPAGDAPNSVILKMGHLDGAGHPSNPNKREIAFYRDVAPALRARAVPRCFRPSTLQTAVSASVTAYAWRLDVLRKRQGMRSSIPLCGWPLRIPSSVSAI